MAGDTYRSIIERIAHRKSSSVTVFSDFCRMAACALAAQTREAEYLEIAGRYEADELAGLGEALALLVDEMQAEPFEDVLGGYYLEVAAHSSKLARGEFFTPRSLSQAVARMLVDPEEVRAAGRPISVLEPASGAGGMVLAMAERFAPDGVDLLRVTCQDINPVAADMTFINTTLWGIPARVVWGDTLRMTVSGCWRNVHWMRVGEDFRLAVQRLSSLPAEVQEPVRDASAALAAAGRVGPEVGIMSQVEFDLDLGERKERCR